MALGIIAVWIGLIAILTAFSSYTVALIRSLRVEAAANAATAEGKAGRKGSRRRATRSADADEEDPAGAGGVRKPLLLARRSFYLSCICVAIAAVVLETLILNQRYEVFYIYKNTNAALPFF